MKIRSFISLSVAVAMLFLPAACSVSSKTSAPLKESQIQPLFTQEQMPDLVKCLPAPPAPGSPEFAYDSLRYFWGKEQRKDAVRAETAAKDAAWEIDEVFARFNEAFGMEISRSTTPAIWELLMTGIKTIDLIRIHPKAYFHRIRPFEYFNEHMYSEWEEAGLRGEGSYPSGHTIRAWSIALMLAEIAPDRAETLYAHAWEMGQSRVIVGAHWQSDVDNSRAAASIGYSFVQTNPIFRERMEKAKQEYASLTK